VAEDLRIRPIASATTLDVIADILGHNSLDVTAHYAQVSNKLMMQTYSAAHPHALAKSDPREFLRPPLNGGL
jgi:hypothetical protein